jgi:hypothetical protein
VRMGDTGFSHFPSGPDLDLPTFISDRGCTVIDYVVIRGAPCSGYALEVLTPKGHRSIRLSVDWPPTTVTRVRDRTSQHMHFRSTPPDEFFSNLFGGARSVQAFRLCQRRPVSCFQSPCSDTRYVIYGITRPRPGVVQ